MADERDLNATVRWQTGGKNAGFFAFCGKAASIRASLRTSWVPPHMTASRKTFCLVMVKPSHYDDDGYVIQWKLSPIPSNSLASVYGLARTASTGRCSGPDWDIRPRRDRRDQYRGRHRGAGGADRRGRRRHGHADRRAVQPVPARRSISRGRCWRGACRWASAAFTSRASSRCSTATTPISSEAQAHGDLAVRRRGRGAARARCCATRCDGQLKPLYNFMNDLPGIENTPVPFMPAGHVGQDRLQPHQLRCRARAAPISARSAPSSMCRGASRAGARPTTSRRSSGRTSTQGVYRFFITDDNFARNKDWEPIMDRLIELREVEKLAFQLLHPGRHALPQDPEFHREMRARRRASASSSGSRTSTRPTSRTPRSGRTRSPSTGKMLLAWKEWHVITYAGYILGFPTDTPERIMHDIDVVKNELPVDILEFFFLTPLPGSEDHQKLHRAGVAMDPDLNKYDLNHYTTAHPLMTQKRVREGLRRRLGPLLHDGPRRDDHAPRRSLGHRDLQRAAARRVVHGGAQDREGAPARSRLDAAGRTACSGGCGMKIEPAVLFYPKVLRRACLQDDAAGRWLYLPLRAAALQGRERSQQARPTPTRR